MRRCLFSDAHGGRSGPRRNVWTHLAGKRVITPEIWSSASAPGAISEDFQCAKAFNSTSVNSYEASENIPGCRD